MEEIATTQAEHGAVLEEHGGKLDAILEILRAR